MATKTEFKKILKEFGLTEQEFQDIYEDVATTNKLVNNLLNITKIKLCDLPPHLLRQLPTQKEKDIAAVEERRIKEEQEALEKKKAEDERKYYLDHFEEIIVNKIDNKEDLTEREIQELVWNGEVIDRGENRRWSRGVTSIVELCGRTFAIDWEEGLTESQENEYYNQPYEVEKKEYEKTITVTEWVKI